MRKLLFVLIACISLWSCSTSPNNNGGTNTTIIPLAPSGLTGNVVSSSKVNLTWTDNSTNETGFKIERRQDGGFFALIGVVNTDIYNFNDTGLLPSTNYTYRVYSYNAVGNSINYSNEITITTTSTIIPPTIIYANPSLQYYSTEAYCSGYISNFGGEAPSEWGVCWNTSPNPTISNFKKIATSATNNLFTVQLTNLVPGTTYYIRAYATNSAGTGYTNDLSFTTKVYFTNGSGVTDIDGNTYQTKKLGTQEWMAENLRTSKYSNGDIITSGSGSEFSSGTTSGLWCYYENNSLYNNSYGKLYNWYAVNDSRNVCPVGWHIPSQAEWTILINYLEGNTSAGGRLKEAGTFHWLSPNVNANNESGLAMLPGGARTYLNTNESIGSRGYYWTSNSINTTTAFAIELLNSQASTQLNSTIKSNGFSVRCVKN